jgi:hypothetical protein
MDRLNDRRDLLARDPGGVKAEKTAMLRGPIRPLTMLTLSATVLCLSTAAVPCAAQTRPNIVFILTDDLDLNLVQFMPHVLAMERTGVCSGLSYTALAGAAATGLRCSANI